MSLRMHILTSDRDPLEIPGDLSSLEAFSGWTESPAFPEVGRIDWIRGDLTLDLIAESPSAHGTLKVAITCFLAERIEDEGKGIVLVDRTRVTVPEADLSVEPDVLVVLTRSLESGKATLRRTREGEPVGIQGPPDLIVECLSPSSIRKDRVALRDAYHAAGVREYWIADGRVRQGYDPRVAHLEILEHTPRGYRESDRDARGRAFSPILQTHLAIRRIPLHEDLCRYQIDAD
jgi:Uma2 family endonuclease